MKKTRLSLLVVIGLAAVTVFHPETVRADVPPNGSSDTSYIPPFFNPATCLNDVPDYAETLRPMENETLATTSPDTTYAQGPQADGCFFYQVQAAIVGDATSNKYGVANFTGRIPMTWADVVLLRSSRAACESTSIEGHLYRGFDRIGQITRRGRWDPERNECESTIDRHGPWERLSIGPQQLPLATGTTTFRVMLRAWFNGVLAPVRLNVTYDLAHP